MNIASLQDVARKGRYLRYLCLVLSAEQRKAALRLI